jgi:hypothetical protein
MEGKVEHDDDLVPAFLRVPVAVLVLAALVAVEEQVTKSRSTVQSSSWPLVMPLVCWSKAVNDVAVGLDMFVIGGIGNSLRV